MNARELRLWHWRAAMSARASARLHEAQLRVEPVANEAYHQHRASQDNRRADMHISAVQVLNDFPGLEFTTAEQDDHDESNPRRLVPRRKPTTD